MRTTEKDSLEIKALLCQAQHSSAALKSLFLHLKSRNKSLSLGYLCQKAGIPSRGYISDVLSGKRRLHPKYHSQIVQALGLTGYAKDYLLLSLARDGTTDQKELAKIDMKKLRIEKAWRVERPAMTSAAIDPYFAIQVFCAFGLFANEPRFADLKNHFGTVPEAKLLQAVQQLQSWGLVADRGRRYALLKDQVVFAGSDDRKSHLVFLDESLQKARDAVPAWFDRRHECHFESVILSVQRNQYQETLDQVRQALREIKANLESSEADMLLAFNIQVFPLES